MRLCATPPRECAPLRAQARLDQGYAIWFSTGMQHRVTQGESITTIALRYGFRDPKAIYDHPDNAELKKKRPSPDILFPGDVVIIPDKEAKSINAPTASSG